jgi:hypothetical protein
MLSLRGKHDSVHHMRTWAKLAMGDVDPCLEKSTHILRCSLIQLGWLSPFVSSALLFSCTEKKLCNYSSSHPSNQSHLPI